MNKEKWITTGLFALMLFAVYFGCETKSNEIKALEKSRALNFERISPRNLVKDSKEVLDSDQLSYINTLEAQLKNVDSDSMQLVMLEQLASSWFSFGNPAVSGVYAEELAKKKEDDESWGIAGTTYLLCSRSESDVDLKTFCTNRSINALETAISFNPDELSHSINLALNYVENPSEANPMKGIQMLLQLNRENPENTNVILQLAKLGLQTNQIEKATARLLTIIEIDPEHNEANCLLAKIYQDQGNESESKIYLNKCN